MKKDCCKVQAVLSVDDRGQMVLPKDIRKKMGIKAGDKLALVKLGDKDETCCLTLIKVERLDGMVKDMLGPVVKDII